MLTLNFHDSLQIARFASYGRNEYSYIRKIINEWNKLPLNIYYTEEDTPFIHYGGQMEDNLYYISNREFRGSTVSPGRLKDILDTSRIPLQIRFDGKILIAGKGLLFHKHSEENIELLFFVEGSPDQGMEELSFFISRKLFLLPEYKKIKTCMEAFLKDFKGEVVITRNIERYIGTQLSYPKFKSIKERKQFNEATLSRLIQVAKEEMA